MFLFIQFTPGCWAAVCPLLTDCICRSRRTAFPLTSFYIYSDFILPILSSKRFLAFSVFMCVWCNLNANRVRIILLHCNLLLIIINISTILKAFVHSIDCGVFGYSSLNIVASLRRLSEHCNFGDLLELDEAVRYRALCGFASRQFQRGCMC